MAEKFIQHDQNGSFQEVEATTEGGAPNADKIPALDASGRLNVNMMPTGLGADTAVLTASGALAAGDFVNVFDDGGTPSVRKADASNNVAPAHGFILASVANGAMATVYFEGNNTAVTGQTVGTVFLSTTAGLSTSTAPSATDEIVQKLGVAVSATQINFEPAPVIVLA